MPQEDSSVSVRVSKHLYERLMTLKDSVGKKLDDLALPDNLLDDWFGGDLITRAFESFKDLVKGASIRFWADTVFSKGLEHFEGILNDFEKIIEGKGEYAVLLEATRPEKKSTR